MRLTLLLILAGVFLSGSLEAQELPSKLSFVWFQGEHSSDSSWETYRWEWDGKKLDFTASSMGARPGKLDPNPGRVYPVSTALTAQQRASLSAAVKSVAALKSLSLNPKGFAGTTLSFTLLLGDPQRSISFEGRPEANPDATGPELLEKMKALKTLLISLVH